MVGIDNASENARLWKEVQSNPIQVMRLREEVENLIAWQSHLIGPGYRSSRSTMGTGFCTFGFGRN